MNVNPGGVVVRWHAVPLLEASNLLVEFPAAGGVVRAADDVSLALEPGEALGLVGESGCGKSVTALALLRLVMPPGRITAGTIWWRPREQNGRVDLLALDEARMRQIRGAELAMIFQEPMTALNPVMKVGEQIAESVRAHERISRREARARAIEVMVQVAIPDPHRRAEDYPHQLSGGLRQRAMIAMAIVCRPRLLIADEPTTALDVTIQAQILDLLRSLRERFGLALLLISHDLAVVAQVADRVAVMYCGRIVEVGPARAVLTAPLHPYTQGLLRAVPRLRSGARLEAIPGTVPNLAALPPGCAFEPRCLFRKAECGRVVPQLRQSGESLVRCVLY